MNFPNLCSCCIGRFNHQKNHRGLLDAFLRILEKCPNCTLNLLGDGELQAETERYAEQLGIQEKVVFHGSRTDVHPYLHSADVFLLPSNFEGMPMTVIEAMGTGLPIVATAVGGVPDMLEHNVSGMLVPCEPERVALAVLQLLEQQDFREMLGTNARQESRKFSADHMARCYYDLYVC